MSQSLHLPYITYLMRLWLDSEDETNWRFSLEDPRTGVRRGFATLDELVSFLQQETMTSMRKHHDA